MNKWIKLLVFLPIPILMMTVNYLVDPAGLFRIDYEAVAQSIVNGNKTMITKNNINERKVKENIIKKMPKHVECIAVGPSLVMGIRQGDAGTDSFYNLGESGADFYDIFAQFGLLEINGVSYNRVIFCIDSYFFDENLNKTFTRNMELKPYAEYMLDVLDGNIKMAQPKEKNGIYAYKQLLSPQLFQTSFHLIKDKGLEAAVSGGWIVADNYNGDKWKVADQDIYEWAYYMPDGSWVYGIKTQKYDEKYVVKHSNEYAVESQFSKGKHLGNYQKDSFEKLVKYLLDKNVRVDLYLCPVAPTLWDRINNEEYYVLNELEEFAHNMSSKYNLKLTGSYNPYKLGMTNKDFYDSRHVRHELLSTYFDFKP
ncbi:hypothetical protein [Anaerovibrio lipolyticus]|uniref:hypothetical protein n=1 Tax=Anaerovibrio lipolyticus TaxID=82374 RepID=UPI0026EE38E2|nr:hypothetical protein [Anaerovibrio lipolyticus]MBE6105453.1 hypothetical protein [Anaerovibrio lipolyticus]